MAAAPKAKRRVGLFRWLKQRKWLWVEWVALQTRRCNLLNPPPELTQPQPELQKQIWVVVLLAFDPLLVAQWAAL
jgi:hypothetical protein